MSQNDKQKVSTESYKGVRDFYPEDMAIQNYIFNTMKKTAEIFGYSEYSASVLESAELYRAKSGDEIVNEQTYTFKDRGEREVSLRPEMTPTVARMIAANIDFEIKINNRKIINYILNDLFKLSEENSYKIAKLIDKKNKISKEVFDITVQEIIPEKSANFIELLNSNNFEEFISKLPQDDVIQEAIIETKEIISKLENLGISNVVFAQDLMRGFDYYTGMIFEVFDKNPENRRAVFGGGRYDELLAIFDKEVVPAVGFGMGDVVIKDILETYGLLPKILPSSNLHICVMDKNSIDYAQDLAQKIRENDIKVTVDYSGKRIGDQIKYADKNKIPFIICIGEKEVKNGKFKIKELSTGIETETIEDQVYKVIKL